MRIGNRPFCQQQVTRRALALRWLTKRGKVMFANQKLGRTLHRIYVQLPSLKQRVTVG